MLEDANELQVYTMHDLEDFLKLNQRTIYNHLKSGSLKGIKIGNKWRFTRQQILDYFQKLERKVEVKNASKD